jgi:peptidoglycan-N-acetylglucosamine deacetylase
MLSPLAGGICVLGAAGLAVGGYAYAAQWPGSRVFGRALIAPRRPGELALTFDDGPNPACTPKLLDVLARHGVHATFFMLGSRAQAQPALVRRLAAEGHLVGNHSWDHPNLAYTGTARVAEELRKAKDAIEQASGVEVRYFRPPFGARRPAVFRIARRLGMTTVLWNAMTSDWSEPSVDKIVDALSAKIDGHQRRGWATTIVLHDGGHLEPAADRGPSVAAAGRLLDRYAPTHRFVTIDAWGKTAS